jgi:hypothetical protein
MNSDSGSIRRSRRNAHRKLKQAQIDLQFAKQIGLTTNQQTILNRIDLLSARQKRETKQKKNLLNTTLFVFI